MRLTWLIENKLAASGMPWPEDLPLLAGAGIDSILSLTERSPFPDGTPNGTTHLHLPIADMTAPDRGTLTRAVDFLRDRLEGGASVLVHCGAGLGRTGTVLAAYLVSEGIAPDDAMHLVRAARPGSIETYDQEQCIREFSPEARDAGSSDV
ncbi:MAG: dual specificity protein phosphatase family protein [Planctomycetota bacterium]